jgi:hypothetical protein
MKSIADLGAVAAKWRFVRIADVGADRSERLQSAPFCLLSSTPVTPSGANLLLRRQQPWPNDADSSVVRTVT